MQINTLHEWSLTPTEAIALQKQLAGRLDNTRPLNLADVHLVAGVDVSVKRDGSGQNISQAAVVVLTFPELKVVETVCWQMPTPFPYIPGLLTFREGPVLQEAFSALEHTPDAFVFDGMGIAHPRRIGLAAHLGLWLEKPAIGIGKTRLFGQHEEPPDERGAWSPLTDHDDTIGAVLRTRAGVRPVYVSSGNLIDLPGALRLTLACTTRYRLPEPVRAAHKAAHL